MKIIWNKRQHEWARVKKSMLDLFHPSLIFAWTKLPVSLEYTFDAIHYFIDPHFCGQVLSHLYEDTVLTWSTFDCGDLHTLIRDAFDEWQHNSMITFREVAHPKDSTITIRASSNMSTSAIAAALSKDRIILINDDTCWYTDRSFCAAVVEHTFLIWMLLIIVWSLTGIIGTYFIVNPLSRVDAIFRVANWAVFIACPFILFSALFPCTYCYDLKMTLMHEVGHILGYGHSNTQQSQQQCGCAATKHSCTLTPAEELESIMFSQAKRTSRACLSRNDVDGLREHFGNDLACGDPVLCYENITSFAGHSRIAVALVYGFLLSLIFVLVRGYVYDLWNKTTRKVHTVLCHVHVPALPVVLHVPPPPLPPRRHRHPSPRGQKRTRTVRAASANTRRTTRPVVRETRSRI